MASYYETADFLGAPPAGFREGLLGYANPAVPALAGNHFVAAWSTDGRKAASVDDWGVFTSAGGLGAGVLRRKAGPLRTTGYHLSLSGGTGDAAFGVGYQGFSGDATALGRYNRLTIGTIARPSPYVSLGLVGNVALETDDREVVGELGVRPLGNSRVTLFADAAWGDGQTLADTPWSAGAAVEIIPGLDVRGRYFENDAVSLGLRLELGRGGLDSQSRIASDGDYAGQVNRIRAGDYEPSAIAETVREGKEHVELSLDGPVRYQETRFGGLFGEAPPRFYEILRTLEQAGENDRVAAVALNLSDLQISPELAWELRTAIETAQRTGVKVVVHMESADMTTYHLASVADVVALDPQGLLTLPGYASSRTFVKGTLDKLGLGVQAWRFFEYKSAFEQFSRTDYSPADSLQRAQYVDDQYALVRDAVAGSRPVGTDSLDRIIDRKTILTAREARQVGLVDTLARWHDRESLLKSVMSEEPSSIDADVLDQIATATRDWGAKPEIAVVYGIGATQVEGGMGSRTLSKQIRELAEDNDVAAVVFRVDSPGGSPVAAAQVGEAIRALAEKKPVIVSQGQLAGSGGYWVSTHADTILAGPNTVTGSIGVIGGWIYDQGFTDNTGLSSDVVQRGERADLFKGLRLPLLGVSIPTRKLTDEELSRIETVIRKGYDQFVATVAEGRDTTEAHIRDVGEGRIYSGLDGKDVGLVDEIGGLPQAIDLARTTAGLAPEESTVREVNPYSGAFNFGQVLPGPLGSIWGNPTAGETASEQSPEMTFLRLMLEHQPGPLVLLPPTYSTMAE
jgi:protease-4